MPKKNNKKQIQPNTNQTSSYSVKADTQFLKEAIKFLTTDAVNRTNLISVAIDSKNLQIFELFEKNNGKLTAREAFEASKYVIANDRVDILKYFMETLKLDFGKFQKNQL
ncbi:hypothetical protein [Rickettsia endosymbiont of Halotydeus destructor]|uniref:hypothetical protein n=1 Tax=Rickettsia endosymbiont of Halotydeus destructor TaxID=2996754 RepID=UPI003BAE70BE